MTKLMQSDSRALNRQNIAERRKVLAGQSDDNLRLSIMQGNHLLWQKEPSWYLAVIEELRARGVIGGPKE